ncbi:MAG: lamin tail domain-containing protein [Bacteroidota bacterium]
MERKILYLVALFPLLVNAQFTDDFSDGNFTENPVWEGSVEKFVVNDDFRLQLNDTEAGEAFLSTASQRVDSTEWLFDAELGFSPSANNNALVYLASSSVNPALADESVYLRMGESGTDDALELIHFSDGEEQVICRGTDGLINSAFSLSIKITYRESGVWNIFIDPLGNGSYVPEAEGNYPVQFNASYFTIVCNYTVSNSDNFSFDNFVVRPLQVDTEPPEITDIEIIDNRSVQLSFSESITVNSAEEPSHYLLDGNIQPENVDFDDVLMDNVTLQFQQPFENQSEYQLEVSGIEDLAGNVMSSETLTFTYMKPFEPENHEVVINELMADVNPEPNGLPAYDYVELFNTTDKLIDLSHCTLSWGASTIEIAKGTTVAPQDYLLLTDEDAGFDPSLPLILFSSFPVNNEAEMVLKTPDHRIIHAIEYEKEWYHDDEKDDGGWSLEMIDPENPCGGIENYSASENTNGGTPGFINSVYAANPDTTAPDIDYAGILSDSVIILEFTERMDSSWLQNAENYALEPAGASPVSVETFAPGYQKVHLFFDENLNETVTTYHLLVSDNLTDCAGNPLRENEFSFSNYKPEYGDIIITEIMADVNPAPLDLPPAEYVELYNRTDYPVELSSVTLFSGNAEVSLPQGTAIASKGYLVVADQPLLSDNVANEFISSSLRISNGGEAVYLSSADGKILHFVDFTTYWYGDPAKEEGGWSLEMIDMTNYCGGEENWSASVAPAGGTPGAANSVSESNPDNLPPDILRVTAIDENRIKLTFDEIMDRQTLSNPDLLKISPSGNQVQKMTAISPAYNAAEVVFEKPLNPETTYSLSVERGITDCAGNHLMLSDSVLFSYPLGADTADVVINEILFNSSDQNTDFLEIYNTSDHAVDLSSLYILQIDPQTETVDKKIPVTQEKIILVKNKPLAITQEYTTLKSFYPDAPARNIIQVEGLTNFHSSAGIVAIENTQNQQIDYVRYNEEMHYELIDNPKDVSLERVDPYMPSANKDNWHSAAESAGFATPGQINSQRYPEKVTNKDIRIKPEIITPNNDGKEDVAALEYNFDRPGYSLNISVYDAKGRKVSNLANNYMAGKQGRIFWDGTADDSQPVTSGYYVFFIEVFDMEGYHQQFKKTLVVSYENR